MLAVAFTTGCAVKKDFYATGGSRADGTVDMAYDFAQFEQPLVNPSQAQSIAQQKCTVWGYREAEAFGGKTTNCNQRDGWGNCVAGQVVIKYQCIGDLGVPSPERVTQVSSTAAPSEGSLSKAQWQQQQLDELSRKSIPYEQYQQEYRRIMGQ
ncbi:MAG: hypothetical protein CTR55_22050 [Pseudomonas sp.]|nr:MAG: hypothetical protein CTR55_22050 [Pseudomonas sp.]